MYQSSSNSIDVNVTSELSNKKTDIDNNNINMNIPSNGKEKLLTRQLSGYETKVNSVIPNNFKRPNISVKTISDQRTASVSFSDCTPIVSANTSSYASFENLSANNSLTPSASTVTENVISTTIGTAKPATMNNKDDIKMRKNLPSSCLFNGKKKLQRQWATCSSLYTTNNVNTSNNIQYTTKNNGLYETSSSLTSSRRCGTTERKIKSCWFFLRRQSSDRAIDCTEYGTNWSNKSRVDNRRKLFRKLGYKSANEMYLSENTSTLSESNGFINNAGRFRSEIGVIPCKKVKETSPGHPNCVSFDSSLKTKDSPSSLSENRLSMLNFEDKVSDEMINVDIEGNKDYERRVTSEKVQTTDSEASLLTNKSNSNLALDSFRNTLTPTVASQQSEKRQLQQSSYDTGLNQLCCPTTQTSTSIQQSQSFGTGTATVTSYDDNDEYFSFEHDTSAFYNSSTGSNFKSTSTPLHLENPERETRWYFKYFLGRYHQLYCGYLTERDPFLLAVAKDDIQTYGISQYRAILWRKTGSQKLCISYNPTNALTAKKVLNFFDIHRVEKGPREILNFEVQKDALTLEEQEGSVNFKFGVLYCIEGQTSDQEMYNNEKGSEQFERFVNLLGERIGLKSWDRFKGGLDTKSNTTGIDSVYTIYEGHEIMFHVSTLLPYSTENRQQIERKRHVGNDIVNIIFVDGCPPGQQPSWTPSMMRTHFTPLNSSVDIFAIVTFDSEAEVYRLNIFAEESVPFFGPPLHNPPEFKNPQEFREFLLVKLINGEKAAFRSPVFAQKRQRTLEMLLNAICTTYANDTNNGAIYRRAFSDVVVDSFNGVTTSKEQSRNDAYIRYGQMLKLNTIIRGDAPTSSITSGQSKKNLWQPKLIHKCTQSEIICGDVWGDNLIISTEQGTFGFKDHEPPVLLIDKSVEVKQLEVAQFELLIIRYDKGREAKVAVLQLNCLTSTKPVDRSQAKKLTLEKTKGSQLFTVSKSPNHPLRLAIAVHRRIIVFQWHLFTGRSLSSWNQLAQPDPIENFQIMREVHLIEPVQTLSFVEGIPGGRLCVGYRNQFILVDEKNKETIQLFRTEGSRNQVVSALELWADEEHELLLCFTRTCHFQKLSLTSSSGMGSRRQAPLINSPVDTSFNWNMKTTMETSAVKSSPSLSQTQGSNSVDSPSPTGGPIARSCSPDPLFHPLNISTSCEEKVKTSDFDFAWNFEPQQVAVCFPYIFGFNPAAIEIRLLINGSLVHTMLVSDCRLITAKGDIYFTSTSETLDYETGPAVSNTNIINNSSSENQNSNKSLQQNDGQSIIKALDQMNLDDGQNSNYLSNSGINGDIQKNPSLRVRQHYQRQQQSEPQSSTSSAASITSSGSSMNSCSGLPGSVRFFPSNSIANTSLSSVASSSSIAHICSSVSADLSQLQTNFIYRIPIYSLNKQMNSNENK